MVQVLTCRSDLWELDLDGPVVNLTSEVEMLGLEQGVFTATCMNLYSIYSYISLILAILRKWP